MSPESKNQARWRKLERVVLWFDGFVIFALLSMGFLVALLAIVYGERFPHGGMHLFMGGPICVLLGISFVMQYLGMQRHTRWRWPAHLLPLLAPGLIEALPPDFFMTTYWAFFKLFELFRW